MIKYAPAQIRAIILILCMCFCLQIMSAAARYLKGVYDPFEIIFYRSLVCLIAVSIWLAGTKKLHLLKTRNPKAHVIRSAMGVSSVLLAFWAYQQMPLPQALSLMLTSGLMITALSAIFLKEHVGIWRWGAVIAGFIGALIASQPTGAGFNLWGVLAALGTAFTYAIVTLYLRHMGRSEPVITTVFYFMLFGMCVCGLYMIVWHKPVHLDGWPVLIVIAVSALMTQCLKTEALRLAEASIISPFEYTALIWGYLFSWVLWDEVPNLAVWIGSGLIVASNMVILWREYRRKHHMPTHDIPRQTAA